jgi:excisionase family DNA binding protein
MSDYILTQQADKIVRYNRLPPEAQAVRNALLNAANLPGSEGEACVQITRRRKPLRSTCGFHTLQKDHSQVSTDTVAPSGSPSGTLAIPVGRAHALQARVENEAKRNEALPGPKPHRPNRPAADILPSTNEVATLTGFKPKTIRHWVSRRLLNYIRVGNRLRFRLAAVELFLGQREVRK